MNGFGKLRRSTERFAVVVDFGLAAAVVTTRRLVNDVRTRLQWGNRQTTRKLT